jgi:UDP-glucuronate 4-epimerase
MAMARHHVSRDGPPILVTGAAGFVGFHLSKALLDAGHAILGLDNLNDYYNPKLKSARLASLEQHSAFRFTRIDIADRDGIARLFEAARPTHVIHLAAQAGVRYSIEQPFAYADSNLSGFLSILEACRQVGVAHLLYASSSSVYGGNTKLPFSTRDSVDHPVSLYAATKKANELMAHCYSHLYGLPATGLRFFTVYGPWGRPDMAYWKFTEAIHAGQPIDVYNNGTMQRDFTYIDDVVAAMLKLIDRPPAPDPDFDRDNPDPASSWAPHRVYNIGARQPEALTDMIGLIEQAVGRPAIRRLLPMQPGDVPATFADTAALEAVIGPMQVTPLAVGLQHFVDWYLSWLTESG